MQSERRQHGRVAIRLGTDCQFADDVPAVRAFTQNISTSGVLLDVDFPVGAGHPESCSAVRLNMTVPPGAGYSPYQGRLSADAEVLRCRVIEGVPARPGFMRYGVAARFKQPLRLAF